MPLFKSFYPSINLCPSIHIFLLINQLERVTCTFGQMPIKNIKPLSTQLLVE